MGNSHLFLVIVDTFVLNHSQTISSTVLTTKVLNLRMTEVQNLSQTALMDALIPLNCLKLWKRKMPGIKISPPTSRAMTLNERATTECTFLLLHWNIVFHPAKMSSRVLIYQHYYDAFNESFDEDKLIAYIKTHFMEIRNDLGRTYTWSLIKVMCDWRCMLATIWFTSHCMFLFQLFKNVQFRIRKAVFGKILCVTTYEILHTGRKYFTILLISITHS